MRNKAALLWRRILAADQEAIFENEFTRLLNRNPADRLAQPGYVGRRYRADGLVFVSMNPGNGGADGQSPDDERQYEALRRLRDADEASERIAFEELTGVLADIMPGWDIYRNFLAPVLKGLELDFSQVAYVNLLKWRTKPKCGLVRLYKRSWKIHTREQFELLAPSRVIAIGKGAGLAFQRRYKGAAKFDFIPRVHSSAGPEGRAAIKRIVESRP